MMRNSIVTFSFVIASFLREARCDCSDPGSPFSSHQQSGTIQSPGYPNYYYANEDCWWNLHPPQGRIPQLLLINLVLEMGVGNGNGETCLGVENYVTLGDFGKGCDKEGPICFAFMLNSANDYNCHNLVRRYYPRCKTALYKSWPLKVGFTTKDAHNMKGVQLNYTYIDCFSYPPPTKRPPIVTTSSTTSSTTAEQAGPISKRNTSSSNLSDRPITEDTMTISNPSNSRSSPTRSTVSSTILDAIRTTSKAKAPDNGQAQTGPTTRSILIAVFIVLCVIFVILLVIFFFRRRIKEFTRTSKLATKLTTSPTNNNNIKVMDNYVIPPSYETAVGLTASPQATAPNVHRSTNAGEIPSISSTLISPNSDNRQPFHYNHLRESISNASSEDSIRIPSYPPSHR